MLDVWPPECPAARLFEATPAPDLMSCGLTSRPSSSPPRFTQRSMTSRANARVRVRNSSAVMDIGYGKMLASPISAGSSMRSRAGLQFLRTGPRRSVARFPSVLAGKSPNHQITKFRCPVIPESVLLSCPVLSTGSTCRRRFPSKRCAERWSCSISGRMGASTACTSCRTFGGWKKNIGMS